MDIFEEIKKAGVEFDHYCSDLYFPKNGVTMEIVSRYEYKNNVETFTDNITGKPWYSVWFAYTPHFEHDNQ
jgi:hypothetical protein